MSVAGYLGRDRGELRIPSGDPILKSPGKVLSGAVSVEVRQRTEAMKDRRAGVRYRRVEEYDAVLRGHCRLGWVGDEDL